MQVIIVIFSLLHFLSYHPDISQQEQMVYAVNKVRTAGCKCGNAFFKPVQKIKWNETLYQSAFRHAEEMNKYHFFGHKSISGLDIGARLDKIGYNWAVAGENLGEGQISFDEVLKDWIKSPTHCTMLMNPKVNEMAVAKVDKYWVQHFGKVMKSGS